jgi:L-lactate dehydrogenase (cytochrome)
MTGEVHCAEWSLHAVGSRIEVHMDGGIRSGQDVLKAWARGARGTYIGRAMVWGLGAMGAKARGACLEGKGYTVK